MPILEKHVYQVQMSLLSCVCVDILRNSLPIAVSALRLLSAMGSQLGIPTKNHHERNSVLRSRYCCLTGKNLCWLFQD